ncbi:thiamine pyrophosphokinase 1, partial [Asbolus verrucosus]
KMHQGARNEIWDPCENLLVKCKDPNYAVVILNTYIKFQPSFLLNLWNQAKVKILVDGGTERWLSWLKLHNVDFDKVNPPDLITGDMDSLSENTLDFFVANKMCKVVRTPDQNETDFTKALRELNKFCISQNDKIDIVYVIAENCGRFDQILANINTLYKAGNILKNVKIFLIASKSLTWLLSEGITHTINIPLNLRQNHEWCALIPIGSPSFVSTSGLKWNLDKSKMEFGDLVSTSNTYDDVSSAITVHTDKTIVWSMGIKSLLTTD